MTHLYYKYVNWSGYDFNKSTFNTIELETGAINSPSKVDQKHNVTSIKKTTANNTVMILERSSEQIKAEIELKFGFVPPFFAPASKTPQVLENLWQQTLIAYVNNPLPALFKEKLFAYLSRFCAVPYCIICHSCTLRPLGMSATEVLELLEAVAPNSTEIEKYFSRLGEKSDFPIVWPRWTV